MIYGSESTDTGSVYGSAAAVAEPEKQELSPAHAPEKREPVAVSDENPHRFNVAEVSNRIVSLKQKIQEIYAHAAKLGTSVPPIDDSALSTDPSSLQSEKDMHDLVSRLDGVAQSVSGAQGMQMLQTLGKAVTDLAVLPEAAMAEAVASGKELHRLAVGGGEPVVIAGGPGKAIIAMKSVDQPRPDLPPMA